MSFHFLTYHSFFLAIIKKQKKTSSRFTLKTCAFGSFEKCLHFGLEFLSDFPDFNWKHWKLKFVTSDFDGKKQGRKMRHKTRPIWGLGNHFCRKVCHGFLISRGKLLGLFNLGEFQATFEGVRAPIKTGLNSWLFNSDPCNGLWNDPHIAGCNTP